MTLSRRPVRPEDHAWCRDLEHEGLRSYVRPWFAWDEAEQRRRFDATFRPESARILVEAEADVGWLALASHDDHVAIDKIYIVAHERGRGLGTRAIRQVVRDAGPRAVQLRVLKNNPAMRLYHRLGFRIAEMMPDRPHQWLLRRTPGPDPREPVVASLSEDEQRALCKALPIGPSGEGVRASTQGSANHTWLFDEHVVRIAVGHDTSFADARTEAVAVPAVVRVGIRTPELVWLVERHPATGAPVTVYRRVPGWPVLEAPRSPAVWAEVGRELGRLHQRVRWVPDGAGWLESHTLPGLSDLLSYAGPDRDWLARWAAGLPTEPGRAVLLHGDAHAGNVLVDDQGFAALIDWGDAGFADAALDFEPIDVAVQPAAVAGWRETVGWDDPTLEGRILRADLEVALLRIACPKPTMVDPRAPLKALSSFLRTDPGPRWTRWFSNA